jgi:hypothetical protein
VEEMRAPGPYLPPCDGRWGHGRLASAKYQRAIAGLVMAQSIEWSFDLREHDFDDTKALLRALCATSCLVSLNSLSLKDDSKDDSSRPSGRISETLQLDRWPAALGVFFARRRLTADRCRRTGCLSCFAGRKEFEVLRFFCFWRGRSEVLIKSVPGQESQRIGVGIRCWQNKQNGVGQARHQVPK